MARVLGSYPLSRWFKSYCRYQIRPVGQEVKTPPFHGGIMGSIPVRVTKHMPRKIVDFTWFSLFKGRLFGRLSFICPLLSVLILCRNSYFLDEKSSAEAIASAALACAC